MMRTSSTYSPSCRYSAITSPAGVSRRSTPGVFGVTSPFSIAMVTVPIVPWPHIGRQPEVSMNRMAMSQSVARRRIEDRARHHVVAARLEHQPGADPVVFGAGMRAPLHHGRALEQRPAAGDQPHRIAAGAAV